MLLFSLLIILPFWKESVIIICALLNKTQPYFKHNIHETNLSLSVGHDSDTEDCLTYATKCIKCNVYFSLFLRHITLLKKAFTKLFSKPDQT